MSQKPASLKLQFGLFAMAIAFMSMAAGINESIFNNFLSDTFHLSASARGWLELPRELPGFLVVLMMGILATLPVTRLGVVGTLGFAVGAVGLAVLGSSFWIMVPMMVLASTGTHLLMPVTASITLSLGNENNRGKRMGQIGSVETVGFILGTGFVWLFFSKTDPQYRMGFLVAAVVGVVAMLFYWRMHIPALNQPRAKLVFRKKYCLYYALELLFGARKQIFITFGPWVLIRIYDKPASSIAGLLMIAAILGIVFRPLIGMAIDRFGERRIMIADGLILCFVCLGYGYALKIAAPDTARLIASSCFVADQLLFAMGAARAIYVSRLTTSPQEITSTLSMGVSLNHVISMTIPMLAGFVWVTMGYERVFLGAAVLALAISALSLFVPRKKIIAESIPQPAQVQPTPEAV